MAKRWYSVSVLSNFEKKVAEAIRQAVAEKGLEEQIDEVLVPTEEVIEIRRGKKVTSERRFMPGYVLVHMRLYDDQHNLLERTWYFIQETPGIIGFVGGERPVPLKSDEVETIFRQIEDKREKIKPKVEFEPGETVKVNDGPFLNFSGVIEEVDPDRGKIKVSVSIFGRTAPVELEYWQVERA